MSDEQGTELARTDTDAAIKEVAAGFSSRFPHFRCVVCASENFFLLDKDKSTQASRFNIYSEESPGNPNFFETATLACATCGHLYQFLLNVLHRTVKEGSDDGGVALP